MHGNILVKFERDWADEFTVYGLAILTLEQYELTLQEAKCINWHFGSNEGYEEEDISDGFSIVSDHPAVIQTFEETLPFYQFSSVKSWGHFPDALDSFWNRIFNEYEIYDNSETTIVVMPDGSHIPLAKSTDGYEFVRNDIGKRFPMFAENES